MLIPSIHSFFYLSTALLKSNVFGTQKPTPPTVFNLQASDWVHCEEERSVYYQMSRITSKFVFFFSKLLKLLFLPQKNTRISKNSIKFIINFFFQKEIIGHMYIFTTCIDNFKFTISLKSYEEEAFEWVPQKTFLFSITCFLYGWQKIFTNKNIFSKHDWHVLFISFFSKMYNKNFYLSCYSPLSLLEFECC